MKGITEMSKQAEEIVGLKKLLAKSYAMLSNTIIPMGVKKEGSKPNNLLKELEQVLKG